MTPAQFWDTTPMELDALCGATLKAHPKYVEPISREEYEAMKTEDERRASGQ